MFNSKLKKSRSFLKWAGNKHQLVDTILENLPKGKRLIEPFVGSGVVFLNSNFSRALLSDINPDLINIYQFMQNEGVKFIDYTRRYFDEKYNTEEQFYLLREEFNQTKNIRKKAALFLYLNRHCFNGLCRYNSSGLYNVPYGRYRKPFFPDEAMHHFLAKFQNATFEVSDFESVMLKAKKGDVIYCDPPYVPLSKTASFTRYATNDFGEEQQVKLATLAKDISKKGITVVISNHDTPYTKKIYQGARFIKVNAMRSVASRAEKRGKVKEILAVFEGKK